ncbi:MAG: redoxin domain-containing protein [Chloroflexi bacterium]|nr:redoxin domain-containing protein [Chloroflexota bacterium]
MSKKKKRKQKAPEPFLSGLMRRYRKWPRRIGIMAGLVGVVVAVIVFANPFGGAPTAIDANGEEVKAGIIDGQPGASPRNGSPAPNFLLPDYDRRAVRLSDYEDKIVVINFWAGWCTECDREMPDIVRIAKKFPDDLVVLAVNAGDSKGTAENWARDRDLPLDLANFVWVLDEREGVTRKYQLNGMPHTFLVDRGGTIFSRVDGGTTYEALLQTIEFFLPPEPSATTN